MATQSSDRSNAPLPGTVFNERQIRLLKRIVIAMGGLLLVGFTVLVIAMVYQASKLGKTRSGGDEQTVTAERATGGVLVGPSAVPGAGAVRALYAGKDGLRFAESVIPPGARHVATTVDGERMFVSLEDAGGLTVVQVDLANWTVVGAVRLSNAGGK